MFSRVAARRDWSRTWCTNVVTHDVIELHDCILKDDSLVRLQVARGSEMHRAIFEDDEGSKVLVVFNGLVAHLEVVSQLLMKGNGAHLPQVCVASVVHDVVAYAGSPSPVETHP